MAISNLLKNINEKIKLLGETFEKHSILCKILIIIIDDVFNNNFKRLDIQTSCTNPENLARVTIFFALQHKDYSGDFATKKVDDFLESFPIIINTIISPIRLIKSM